MTYVPTDAAFMLTVNLDRLKDFDNH